MLWWPLIIFSLLVVGALFYPWLSRGRQLAVDLTDQQQVNIALYKESLAVLEAQQQSGEINTMEYEGQLADLQRRLLDDNRIDSVAGQQTAQLNQSRQTPLILLLTAGVVVVASFALYRHLGATDLLEISALSQQFYREQLSASREQRAADFTIAEQLIEKLQRQLKKQPEDPSLVYLLGATYAQLSDYERALPLYKQYLMQNPTHESVLTEYVQFLYIAAGNQLTERVNFVVERALSLNPHNQQVLGLLAMHHYQAGDFDAAIDYWRQMLATTPQGSEAYSLIQNAIERARQNRHNAASGEVRGEPGGETVDKPVDVLSP